ncbi:MAG TPA: PIN domain-containing protein [Terrimesophilobacter sp.]|uniref:PIN domain-containing protein n=1 Tax=Terrimesophilobacter sp. TaxID=2906435 RepID=UPI002F94862C
MTPNSPSTSVVFDVQVLVNALVGPESTFPLITGVPPSTDNAAADCLSIAFDAEEFRLHSSPHILTNAARVLKLLGISADLAQDYLDTVLDIIAESGGQIIEPPRTVFEISDYEDNLILDLVVATDSLILISDDTDLTQLNPWNGRLILRPREFVSRVVQSRRGR